jgi:gluconolactonase
MIATPQNVEILGKNLDHPEGVCVGPQGELYAGGEAGQLYCLTPEGDQREIASTGGFLLGLALDGTGSVHACDSGRCAVVRIDPDGTITERSRGAADRPMAVPNYPVFDSAGNLYVSDSGDYWEPNGTGCVWVVRPDDTTEMFHAGPFRFTNGLAIDSSGEWLYVIQSTAANVVRVPLNRPDGPIEIVYSLPSHTVPDGLAFATDGRLVISCYRPDAIYVGYPEGTVELWIEDLTAELLMRPTNVALHGGKLYIANLGGWHIAALETDMQSAPLHRPVLR